MASVRFGDFAAFRLGLLWLLALLLGGEPLVAQGLPGGGGAGGGAPKAPKLTFEERVLQEGGPRYQPVGDQPLVAEILIEGNESVDEAQVLAQIRTRKERQFDPEELQSDVRRLMRSGLFQNVRTKTQEVPGGLVVTFEVFERPTIHYIKYLGNRGVSDKKLGKEAGLAEGDALNQYAVQEARRKLEEYYRTKGYPKCEVSILEGDQPQDRGVVFVISEGQLERIGEVRFIGNEIASAGRLKTQIQSKPGYLYYFLRGKVDRSKIDEDVERLTAYYRSLGYFRARVGRELDYDESGKWLTLTFVIDEGPRYKIRNVTVSGNQKLTEDDLRAQLQLQPGDYFNLSEMNRDVNTLRDLYGSQGHIFADIKSDPRFLEEPGQLDLVYNIQEGDLFRVGEINVHIAGEHPHTRQSVVLNRISLSPGDVIDIREVRNSERRLKSSQLFENDPSKGIEPRIVIRPPDLTDAIR